MVIRALVFDAYGTLYDVQSVLARATELCGAKGALVTQLWRLKQLEYSWLAGLMGTGQDFWDLTRASLEFSLDAAGIAPEPAIVEPLMQNYLALDLYPEAVAALDALAGYQLAILSNGSRTMLEALVAASGVAGRFADVISVDRARSFKPDPACYALVEPALGVTRDEVLFVSSNGFDIAGAKSFGFQVARIARNPAGTVPEGADIGPQEFLVLQRGRSERLGPPADRTVARLTDLAGLIGTLGR